MPCESSKQNWVMASPLPTTSTSTHNLSVLLQLALYTSDDIIHSFMFESVAVLCCCTLLQQRKRFVCVFFLIYAPLYYIYAKKRLLCHQLQNKRYINMKCFCLMWTVYPLLASTITIIHLIFHSFRGNFNIPSIWTWSLRFVRNKSVKLCVFFFIESL